MSDMMETAKQEALAQRDEAKSLLRALLNLPQECDKAVDKVVDCIIGSAILEVVILNAKAEIAGGES